MAIAAVATLGGDQLPAIGLRRRNLSGLSLAPILYSGPFSILTSYLPMFPKSRLQSVLLIALALTAVNLGCVQRRMMIRSYPEGALVYLNGQEIGRTPVTTNFTYYGDFEVKLVKDGYETETIIQPVPMPWYQIPPIDFVSENIVPQKIHDRRELSYNLRPKVKQTPEQIRAAAEQMRMASRGHNAPVPTPAVGETVPAPPGASVLPQPLAPELLPPPGVQPPAIVPQPAPPIGPGFNPGVPNWPTQ